MSESAPVRVTNAELTTVRETMRELPRLLAELDAGAIEKLVLTQRNQMRAVLVSVERYSELEQAAT
jgi:PHD/YefM family antitoxin component YafN of YafNO toxin-antitoxin module